MNFSGVADTVAEIIVQARGRPISIGVSVEVAERLKAIGIKDSGRDVSNNVGRGTFSATFMLQVLAAIGCTTLRIDPPEAAADPQV